MIGITESKLDKSIFEMEIQLDNYKNGGGVACYIRSGKLRAERLFSKCNRKLFFEILLPKTTPIKVGIMYSLPSQTNFLEI